MYHDKKIGVVIPCFNVSPHIGIVLDNIPGFADLVVPVDDSSTDDTAEILKGRAGGRIQPLFKRVNSGVGGAVISGWETCIEKGMDVLVKIDGDGQMDPSGIESLLEAMISTGAGYVKGNRFLHVSELASMPLVRKMGNIALTFLTKLASGYWHIFDPQNGFVAISRESFLLLDRDKIAKRYFFENSMLINLNIHSVTAADVPMPAFYGSEKSHLKISDTLFTFPMMLVKGCFHRIHQRYVLRDFSPIVLLLLLGFLLCSFGLIFGLVKMVHYWRLSEPAPTGTVITAALPIILGYQSLLQALLLDIYNSPRPPRGTWQI